MGNQLLNLKYYCWFFEIITGLKKINLSKSNMVGIGVGGQEHTSLAGMFGCKVEAWPLKYLGLALGRYPRSLSFLGSNGGESSKKMACWIKSYISLEEEST